jgi:DNA polymerase-4
VAVKIRYPDFETTSRQMAIPYTFYDDELIAKAKELFHKLYRPGQAIRLLGVRLSELTAGTEFTMVPNETGQGTMLRRCSVQTNLFEDTQKKTELYKAIDDVKNRFGKGKISKAGGM